MTMFGKIIAGSVLLAITSTVALAQVRQLQLSRPMDVNTQVGAGGSNQPVPPGFVPINGNDVMTGNVSGLAYFHGPSSTFNPYQFGGGQRSAVISINGTPTVVQLNSGGSSALSNFARQSAGAPLNGGTYRGVTTPYYLPSSTVSTGQGALYAAPMGGGFDSAVIPRYSYSPAMDAAQVRVISGTVSTEAVNRATSPELLQPGSPGAVMSNPIFTLRITETPTKMPDFGVPATAPAHMQGLTGSGLDTGNELTPDGEKPLQNPNMLQGVVGGGVDMRVTSQSSELKAARVSENYRKLAEELKLAQGPRLPGTETKEPDTGGPGTLAKGPDIDPFTGRPRLTSPLGPATGPALSAGISGAGSSTPSMRGPQTRPSGLSGEGLLALSDNELRAGSTHKPVRIAPEVQPGSSVSGFDLLMSRAEKELSDGDYIKAAESYQGALAIKPEDLLALVGRGNAELAAGIYSGADFDLKFVFARNPKMVGVVYEKGSFIPSSRHGFLLEDLQKMTAKKDAANMASFLYCYLCYQTGKTDLLNAELQKWRARDGHDEWQAVAQRAWGTK
jgi:hypothetical protein